MLNCGATSRCKLVLLGGGQAIGFGLFGCFQGRAQKVSIRMEFSQSRANSIVAGFGRTEGQPQRCGTELELVLCDLLLARSEGAP